jgi:putative tricarboxylic transport membrane protein
MYDLSALMAGLQGLFSPYILALFVVGFLLGFIVGAIPGFNDASLMAILLPFALYLDTTGALVVMATIYGAAQTSGAIPAILLNIPGTPGNSATVLEGYPMARQGRAGYALGVSLAASAVGAVLGGIAALLAAPLIGSFALGFGPAETFLVGAFGLSIVSALTGGSVAKGLLATFFGLLVGLIGADAMTAFPRGTFGILALYDGLPLIPVLLGLFGVSEIVFMMKRTAIEENIDRNSGLSDVIGGVYDTFRYRFCLLYSSAIGAIVGVVPGAGATIGAFVAYGQAKQWSREPEKFGTGHAEGLIASEAANNAVAACAVVPVLTLGLPGSASATVMLAALYLQGVVPGPRLFLNFQTEAYTILLSLILTGIMSLILGIPLVRMFRKITYVPMKYLVPAVAVLLFAGAFAWRFNTTDIMIMIVFGIIGILFKIYKYSIPAFLLALILGPLMESNFLRARNIGGYEIFYQSSISIFMLGLILISLLAPLAAGFRNRIGVS